MSFWKEEDGEMGFITAGFYWADDGMIYSEGLRGLREKTGSFEVGFGGELLLTNFCDHRKFHIYIYITLF